MKTVGNNSGSYETPKPAGHDREAEQVLVRRCRAGERTAHEEFYRNHRRQVAATLFRVLNDRRDVDDLVQEVFVIAFRGLDKFRGDARVSTWLYRIAVNVALGRIRSKARRPPPIPMEQPMVERVGESPETPERALQRAQTRARVHAVIEQLPPKKRIVLFLHEIEGLDLTEIAYIVEANPVTVRTRLFYARKEFYKRMAEEAD